MKDTVQVLRGGEARAYVVAEEYEDGSLLLAPEPVPSASETVPAEDGRAAAVAVPEVAGILEVRDLTVAYGPNTAVDAVGFEIRRGEIFGLLGPNGAGKTCTLSAIEGLVKPQSGTILLDGIDIRRHPNQARARMGVQLQATSFQSELKIRARGRGAQAVQAALGRTATTPLSIHRGRPRPRTAAPRRAHRRP